MSSGTKSHSSGLMVALRLAALRTTSQMSLDQLAKKSGLTKSYLSKLERGLSEPSISSVARLADAFGIGVAELLGDTVSDSGFRILPKDKHRALSKSSDPPLFELLHGDCKPVGSRLNIYIQHPELIQEEDKTPLPHAVHPGEEFIYVLTGTLQLSVADKTTVLNTGDGAWYRSELVHKLYSLGEKRAEILVVSCG
jgi:transcriptional regulator with XRE-family HTH domain